MTYRILNFERNRGTVTRSKNSILALGSATFCYKTIDFGTNLIEENHVYTVYWGSDHIRECPTQELIMEQSWFKVCYFQFM